MKFKNFVAAFLAVFVLPFSAYANCMFDGCILNLNANFSTGPGSYWTPGGSVTFPQQALCGSGSTNHRALLDPGESISQTFEAGVWDQYDLLFNAWLVNDTENFYDQLTITVRNESTQVSEVFYFRGTTWTNCSSSFSQTLQNDYDNVDITLTFEVSSLASSGWYIDNAALWGLGT